MALKVTVPRMAAYLNQPSLSLEAAHPNLCRINYTI